MEKKSSSERSRHPSRRPKQSFRDEMAPKPVHPRALRFHGLFGEKLVRQHFIVDDRWTPDSLCRQFSGMADLLGVWAIHISIHLSQGVSYIFCSSPICDLQATRDKSQSTAGHPREQAAQVAMSRWWRQAAEHYLSWQYGCRSEPTYRLQGHAASIPKDAHPLGRRQHQSTHVCPAQGTRSARVPTKSAEGRLSEKTG